MLMTGKTVLIMILAVSGAAGLCLLYILVKRAVLIKLCKERASGEVIWIGTAKAFGTAIPEHRLKVRFHTDSSILEGMDAWDAMPGEFSVGQQIHVRYNSKRPSILWVEENNRAGFILKVLGLLLVILLSMAALVAVTRRYLGD